MKKNVGKIDTWIRILIALAVLLLYYFKVISGTVAIVLLVVGIVLLLTSLFGYCPLYSIFKIDTCKKNQN